MEIVKKVLIVVLLLVVVLSGYFYFQFKSSGVSLINGANQVDEVANPNYGQYVSPDDIVRNKEGLKGVTKKHYSKHIAYIAPNGKPIFIVANDSVSDEQLLRAYNILAMYLTSDNGYDMKAVANKVAESNQMLFMPDGADGQSKTPMLAIPGQPLYYAEVPTDGGKWYLENDYEHRDAAFEEILHFVHDNGIGIASKQGALPELQKEIYAATINSLPTNEADWGKKGLWGLNSKDWLVELKNEGSLEQEYLASVVDSYYGLWAPFTEREGGMWGLYVAKTRDEIKTKDPKGFEVVEKLLPSHLSYMVRVDPSFEGTFSLSVNEQPYTLKSRYIKDVRLTGSNDSSLIGNDLDNIFMGNSGHNTIDGMSGFNVIQLSGASSEYEIDLENNIIVDTKKRDGSITYKHINLLRFTDKDITIN